MHLIRSFRSVRTHVTQSIYSSQILERVREVFLRTWHYGVTAFGGPPVHFQIFYRDFVLAKSGRTPWLDEQMYQELFALCQGLPGPASTKLLFITVLLRQGLLCALMAFLLWTLPGAIGMFSMSIGVQQIAEVLPDPVYALLSGRNASTVGIVAVAAIQLSEQCIKDNISRGLVVFGACAGLCYSAVWYYPVLVVIGGIVTSSWDLWLGQKWRRWQRQRLARRCEPSTDLADSQLESRGRMLDPINSRVRSTEVNTLQPSTPESTTAATTHRRPRLPEHDIEPPIFLESTDPSRQQFVQLQQETRAEPGDDVSNGVSVKTGTGLLLLLVTSFIGLLVVKSQLHKPNQALSLFANMSLAGTIIFGGGPVVIPLLREYVVTPGWVTPRDFLIGLAVIQAFPGPNFNFAVYLGALTLARSATSKMQASSVGSLLAFIGIFAPGMLFAVCIQAFWKILRTKPTFTATLRGVNATAVGLVYTAVYRLWETGYLSKASTNGRSLAQEPWWVVVAVLAYTTNRWFAMPAVAGILMGGVLGMGWWAATQS